MTDFTVTLPGGGLWTPKFVNEIDQEKCIGCGRCYKVCGREVLEMEQAGFTSDQILAREVGRVVLSRMASFNLAAHAAPCAGSP